MVDLTVLFATRNGAEVLERTLDGYARQTLSASRWKMVVVDNGSTDDTRKILAKFLSRIPITVLMERLPGKNRALNCGIPEIDGELAVITDDDSIPDCDFLAAWLALVEEETSFDLFGGRITPEFQEPPADWIMRLGKSSPNFFGKRSFPDGEISASEIFGPNMAVRSRVFREGHRFNENIGPNGADPTYPMGSETEFCVRMESLGYRAFFSSRPHVRHIVRPYQVTLKFLNNRSFQHGRGYALQMYKKGTLQKEMSRTPTGLLRLFPKRLRGPALLLRALCSLDRVGRANAFFVYHWRRGFEAEVDALNRVQERFCR